MTNKTTALYNSIFEYIEYKVFKLQPNGFMTDFEGGLRKSIAHSYPEAVLRGCLFHFCDAIRRMCLKLGLHSLLISNPDAKLIKYMLMSLPLLPANMIEEGYAHIKETARNASLLYDLSKLFKYFENYWMQQVMKVTVNIYFSSRKSNNLV